jgi:hypothetical protein
MHAGAEGPDTGLEREQRDTATTANLIRLIDLAVCVSFNDLDGHKATTCRPDYPALVPFKAVPHNHT